jgi:copper chaperone CopZ
MKQVLSWNRGNSSLHFAVQSRDIATTLRIALLSTTLALSGCATTPDAANSASSDSISLGAVDTASTLTPGKYALVVFGMSCPKCISNVDLQLAKITGVAHPKVDMKHGIVTIEVIGPEQPSREALFREIGDAGFTLREIRTLKTSEAKP